MNLLVIVSGGMDSITLLHEYRDHTGAALNFLYGSKHNEQESIRARAYAEKLKIPFYQFDLKFIADHFKSDLLKSGGAVPHGHYADESMVRTVVPFRNAIMLSIAVGFAESNGLEGVGIANHFGDHAIYPDCREAFIKAFETAALEGTYKKIKIFAPYTKLSKRDIAMRGLNFGVNYRETYSCYEGGPIHCGKCGTCTERKEALEGFDTTEYRVCATISRE